MRESHIWTGPKSKQEIDRFLDNLLLEGRENTSIAGKSGLQKFNTRRWNVIERTAPGGKGNCKPPVRFAVLINFKVRGNWIDTNIMDESEGFQEYDIPRKLLDLLDGHPPANDYAARWRRKCAERMDAKREGEKLLKRLRKVLQETGERPRVAVGDLTGEFDMRPHRGRDRDMYRPLGHPHSYLLRPESVNAARTLELLREREQEQAPQGQSATETQGREEK